MHNYCRTSYSTCINCAQASLSLTASVSLLEMGRNVSRTDIECSGDTITYRCSVLSNSESIILMWFVTIPGKETVNITHDKRSLLDNVDYLGINITARLVDFTDQDSIESIIVLTVLDDPSVDRTVVECRSAHLDSEMTEVFVNKSGKLVGTIKSHATH